MEQTVYADLFFLINFSMDFLALFLVAKLLDKKIALLRFILSATLGGVYACAALFLPFSGIISFFIDALVCVVMAFVAMGKRRQIKDTLIFSLVFSATSILLGGAMTVLFNLFNKIGLDKLFGESEGSDGVSVWLFAVVAVISGIVAAAGGKFFKKRSVRKQGSVEICYGGKAVSFPCLLDSGNLLREPISRRPCVVIDMDSAASLFPLSFVDAIKKGNMNALCEREKRRIRMVPASSALGESVMYGIRADSVRLDFGSGAAEVDAYVVLSNAKISAKGVKALVPMELAFGAA